MGDTEANSLVGDGRASMTDIDQKRVAPEESLSRRIYPGFVKSDGSLSSQAFTDPQMSVDRAWYRSVDDTLGNYAGYGVAQFFCRVAIDLGQQVVPEPELLNPAHAIVQGHKPKSVQRQFARLSQLVRSPG
jgi:hypothetical protein